MTRTEEASNSFFLFDSWTNSLICLLIFSISIDFFLTFQEISTSFDLEKKYLFEVREKEEEGRKRRKCHFRTNEGEKSVNDHCLNNRREIESNARILFFSSFVSSHHFFQETEHDPSSDCFLFPFLLWYHRSLIIII